MSAAPGLPVLVFDEATIPAEHHFEVFHDTTAPLFDTAPVGDAGAFQAIATDYMVDDVGISRIRFDTQVLRRTSRHVRSGMDNVLAVQLYTRGGLHGSVGEDDALELDSHLVGVVDLAQPFSVVADASDVTWVGIPKERLGALGSRQPATVSFDQTSPRGRILAAAVRDIWDRLGTARASEAPGLAAEITETVSAVLDSEAPGPPDHGLRPAMKEYIAANLDDFDLDAGSLMAVFHHSRSSVYRLFEEEGGVARYIRDQRLLRCFEDLTRPTGLPRRVSDVAVRWGFDNPSHFNRLFKKRFGVPPSEVRARATEALDPGWSKPETEAMISVFHSWVAST